MKIFKLNCIMAFITCCLLTSCSSTTKSEEHQISDVDYIVNLGCGLEKRWDISLNEDEDQLTQMSLDDFKAETKSMPLAEMETIGDLSTYNFENEELKELAYKYNEALNVQIKCTDEFTENERNDDWSKGYFQRAIILSQLFREYGLTVDEKYKEVAKEFKDDNELKDYYINLWIYDISDSIEFNVEDNTVSCKTYKAVINNTTDYSISDMEFTMKIFDRNGVILDTFSDTLNNVEPGEKYYIDFSTSKQFDSIDTFVDASWE